MQHRKFTLASLLVIITLLLPLVAQAASFADPAFEALWQRTDALVQQGKVARTWCGGQRRAHRAPSHIATVHTANVWCNISTKAAWKSTTRTPHPINGLFPMA